MNAVSIFHRIFGNVKWLTPLLSTIYLVIPNCVVLFTTVNLLITARRIARRGRENLRWEGIITTVLIASVNCISVLPYAIYRIADRNIKSLHNPQGFFQKEYVRISTSFLFLNTISNFYIYCFTLSSFREFLWSRIKLLRITSNNYGKSSVCWLYFQAPLFVWILKSLKLILTPFIFLRL